MTSDNPVSYDPARVEDSLSLDLILRGQQAPCFVPQDYRAEQKYRRPGQVEGMEEGTSAPG